jgi:hypothetical protein
MCFLEEQRYKVFTLNPCVPVFISDSRIWGGMPHSFAQESLAKANNAPAPSNFVGSDRCAQCHTAEHKDWLSSQHAVAMQEATEQTVLGHFDGVTFSKDDVTSTFYKRMASSGSAPTARTGRSATLRSATPSASGRYSST